jgi:hypothetical protein
VFNARAVIDADLAAVECGSAVAFTVGGGTTRYAVNQHERGMADGTLEDANPGVADVTAVPVRGLDTNG